MFDLIFRPLRSAVRAVERELESPVVDTERELLVAVNAIERASDSIEHHVEVIEGLATSVEPLTESVNQLTATMRDLVQILAPMAGAERDVKDAEHAVSQAEHGLARFFERVRRGCLPGGRCAAHEDQRRDWNLESVHHARRRRSISHRSY